MEAEGQTRYPTLQNYGFDNTHFSLVILFLWEGGFDRRSGRENSRGRQERTVPPGRIFKSCPVRSTDLGTVPRSAGECCKQRPTSSSDKGKYLGRRRCNLRPAQDSSPARVLSLTGGEAVLRLAHDVLD